MVGCPKIKKTENRIKSTLLLWTGIFILFFQLVQWLPSSISLSYALYINDPNKSIMEEMINAGCISGESIILGRGVYREPNLYLPRGVSLIGEDLGSVIISGDPDNPDDATITVFGESTIRNLVICNGGYGIYIYMPDNQPPTDISIEHNLIVNNENGIFVQEKSSTNLSIIGNTITNNKVRGILVLVDTNRPMLNCKENIITFNGENLGIDFAQQDGPQTVYTDFIDLPNIFLNYNNIYDEIYRTWYDSDGTLKDSVKILNLNDFGKGNMSKNPYFVDANSGDYHLASYSPCIDQGDPNSDYSQEPDPDGNRINLGVFGNTLQASPTLDSDNDGILDFLEGTSDADSDNVPDWNDADTVRLHLASETDMISIHLQDTSDDANQDIKFEDAKIIPSSELPTKQPTGMFPFDVIQFRLVNVNQGKAPHIRMILPKDKAYQSYSALIMNHHINYMALSSDAIWESIPFEMDSNAHEKENDNAVLFNIGDGQKGDRDGINNGVIEHMGVFVIQPQPLTDWKDSGSCLISIVHP